MSTVLIQPPLRFRGQPWAMAAACLRFLMHVQASHLAFSLVWTPIAGLQAGNVGRALHITQALEQLLPVIPPATVTVTVTDTGVGIDTGAGTRTRTRIGTKTGTDTIMS